MQRCPPDDHDDPAGYFWIIRRPQITIISRDAVTKYRLTEMNAQRTNHERQLCVNRATETPRTLIMNAMQVRAWRCLAPTTL